ncbi:MAG: iron-sulfur cluster assembly accessory protein [Novosphingobium sp.]|nr:iron-sulfur cluster assembly accessory protein [Novosphingobium sp.]MCP5380286.1 iron-sulfur cluster assembly accessory protein [Novosphingobium sp.]MCP5389198.1 iron-sulfur cluster assembly accessory protein [Novosphingobium sp.]
MVEMQQRERPAAVILTQSAQQRVAELMARAPADAIGVKLSTPRRGCSGLAYSVDYVSEANVMDERIETPGGTFFIDGASVLYLIGSTMDWVEDDFTAGFVFQNPNAKGSCGCGESFTV